MVTLDDEAGAVRRFIGSGPGCAKGGAGQGRAWHLRPGAGIGHFPGGGCRPNFGFGSAQVPELIESGGESPADAQTIS